MRNRAEEEREEIEAAEGSCCRGMRAADRGHLPGRTWMDFRKAPPFARAQTFPDRFAAGFLPVKGS